MPVSNDDKNQQSSQSAPADANSPDNPSSAQTPENADKPKTADQTVSPQATATPGDEKSAVGELEKLREEKNTLQDRLMRTLADMENLRTRTEREKTDMAKYAVTNFARDILSVGDNIQRALTSVSKEDVEKDGALAALAEGVKMTERELANILDRYGVKPIEAAGQAFDPNKHQAMFEIENPEVAASTIVEVVQPGFMIGERVLRPALVGVSKGGPKRPKEDQTAAADPGSSAQQQTDPGQNQPAQENNNPTQADKQTDEAKPATSPQDQQQQTASPANNNQKTDQAKQPSPNNENNNDGQKSGNGPQMGAKVDKSA